MTVRIVTDTSACLPSDVRDDLGIGVVPITLVMDDESRPADETDRRDLLDRLAAGDRFTTAAPSPGRFLEKIEEVDDGDGVVVVSLASQMSSTHQHATLAARQARAEVRTVDTRTAAGGVGLVAIAAAGAARRGADLDAVEDVARRVSDRVRLVATVESLEYLARSGRVPQLAQKASDSLGIRPLFEFKEGDPKLLRPSLSADAVLDRLVSMLMDDRPAPDHGLHVTALHGDRPDAARELLDRVGSRCAPTTSFIAEFDAAMLVHTGPALLGLAWFWSDPEA
jgi:DegV family protein with EDD domain